MLVSLFEPFGNVDPLMSQSEADVLEVSRRSARTPCIQAIESG